MHGVRAREHGRQSPAERGYDARHRRWRLVVLARHPLCVDPERVHVGVLLPSTVADHIVPLRLWQADPVMAARLLAQVLTARGWTWDMLDAWSLDNGQGLDASCHARKSQREGAGQISGRLP